MRHALNKRMAGTCWMTHFKHGNIFGRCKTRSSLPPQFFLLVILCHRTNSKQQTESSKDFLGETDVLFASESEIYLRS